MELVKHRSGSQNYLDHIYEYSKEELSQMGVELGHLDEERLGGPSPEQKASPVQKWALLCSLGLFVAIIVSFGSVNNSDKMNDPNLSLQNFNHTANIYDGHHLEI